MPKPLESKAETADYDFYQSEVWTAGEAGIESYYIYGLAAYSETIYAFAEGRLKRHDLSPHHLVMKKSSDGGCSWSKNFYLAKSENGECFCNPTPVIDRQTGILHLLYALNDQNNTTRLFYIQSLDVGESWTEPRELTDLFANNPYSWTLHLPGPGHGLQLRDGRLIVQIWHRRSLDLLPAARNYSISIIYSDDRGESWRAGGTIPPGAAQLNESRIVELIDGRLLLNARSGAFVRSPRYFSESFDRGVNWSEPAPDTSLPAAFATDAGLINCRRKSMEYLILIRPDDPDSRKKLTAFLSDDAGKTWNKKKTIRDGPAGYSDAVMLPDGRIGIIYGCDHLDPKGDLEGNVRRTIFACFDLEWLEK